MQMTAISTTLVPFPAGSLLSAINSFIDNKRIDSTGQKTAAGDSVQGSSAAVLCLKKKNMPVPEQSVKAFRFRR